MTRRTDDWAGTPEYRREAFRARLVVLGFGVLAALAFVITFGVVARGETVDGERFLIIDGDTVAIEGERIRIYNIDAPESRRSRCEAELVAGLKAKERLAQLLRAGPVAIDRCEPSGRCEDRFRRTLARLSAGGRDVGEILVAEGLALTWATGPAARHARITYWCGR